MFDLGKLLQGVGNAVNPFDGGKGFKDAYAPQPRKKKPEPATTPKPGAPLQVRQSMPQNSLTVRSQPQMSGMQQDMAKRMQVQPMPAHTATPRALPVVGVKPQVSPLDKGLKGVADAFTKDLPVIAQEVAKAPITIAKGAGKIAADVGTGMINSAGNRIADFGDAGANVIREFSGQNTAQEIERQRAKQSSQASLNTLKQLYSTTADPAKRQQISNSYSRISNGANDLQREYGMQQEQALAALDPRKTITNAAETALDVATAGRGSVLVKGLAKPAATAVTKQSLAQLGRNTARVGLEGAGLGATYAGVDTARSEDATLVDYAKNMGTGALIGGVAGVGLQAGIPVLAKTAKATASGVNKGVQALQDDLRKPVIEAAEKASGLPKLNVLNDNEAYTLSDYADIVTKRFNAPNDVRNKVVMQARNAAKTAGFDITNMAPADADRTIASYLQARDTYKNTYSLAERQMLQGGFAKLPAPKGDISSNKAQQSIARVQAALNPDDPMKYGKLTATEKKAFKIANGGAELNTKAVSQNTASPTLEQQGQLPQPVLTPNIQSSVSKTAKATLQTQKTPESPLQIGTQKPENNHNVPSTSSILPEKNFKQVKFIDKAARSTRSIIERQGESGKVLANLLRKSRDDEELMLAGIEKQMPTVKSLLKNTTAGQEKRFANFVDVVERRAAPQNEKIARAADEWRATHPQIRDRAMKAGIEVGDLGPDYFPHLIDYDLIYKDKNTYNQAINHLVKTGQAPTPEDAIKLLSFARDTSRNRQFGNLESSRLIDLPFYDKSPGALLGYLQGSAKRISQVENLGMKDEKALKLIANAGADGFDTEAMKNAYDIASGAKQYNPAWVKFSGATRGYVTTTRLGLGALTNTSQNVNTGIVTGHLRTFGAMLKQFNPKTRAFVEDTGVIADAVISNIKSQAGFATPTGKFAARVKRNITAPGFGAVEKFNRSVAATAGRDYALRLAQKGDAKSLKILQDKLRVTGEIKNKTLTDKQQIEASRAIVEKTQFKVDPQDLPGWADSPGGKLVAQFRTFSYNQGKFFSNEVIKPAAKGNLMPLTRVLAALPLGYALYETRRVIDGRPEEENPDRIAVEAFGKIGGAGIVLDLYRAMNPLNGKYIPPDRRIAMALSAFGGPAAGIASQVISSTSEASQKKNIPEDESKLEGKVTVKSGDGYHDLTSVSRLGIQQLPAIGTPIANRVLPYKKKEEGEPFSIFGVQVAGASSKPAEEKTALSAAKAIEDGKKERTEKFKASLSKEDYAITNLSKKEQQTLVDDGTISQKKLDGLRNYVDNKKTELGYDDDKKVKADKTYKQKYDDMQDDYKKNSKSWSVIERHKKEKDLEFLAVQKEYDNDTVGLYGMSKSDVYDIVSNDKNGKKYVDDILKYGDALVKAGLIEKNKYRDKYGNVLLDDPNAKKVSKAKGGSKKTGKGSKGGKGSTFNAPTYDVSTGNSALARLLGTTKAASIAKAPKLAPRKASTSQPKVAIKKSRLRGRQA